MLMPITYRGLPSFRPEPGCVHWAITSLHHELIRLQLRRKAAKRRC